MTKSKTKKRINKSERTKEKILAAARKVYAKYSYEAGSIRMIAREGGFEFALIRYYFPNKAELFHTVFKMACEEMFDVYENATKGLNVKTMGVEKVLSLHLDRTLDHWFENPETPRIIMNNIYWPEAKDVDIPGYEFLPHTLSKIRKFSEKIMNIRASDEEHDMFSDSMNAHFLMFVGSPSFQASLLGLEPDSQEYKLWIKKTMMYIYLPHLKRLLFF